MNKEAVLNFYEKYKNLLFPLVVIVASIILIGFVIYPQINKLLLNQEALDQVNKKSDFLEVKAAELSNIDDNELNQKLAIALSALPSDQDLGGVIGAINKVVLLSNFTVNSLQLGQAENSNTNQISVRVDVTGPKELLPNLLTNIENSTRVMKVDSISVSSTKAGVTSATLIINVFFQPNPKSLGSVDAPLPKLTEKDQQVLTRLAGSIPQFIPIPQTSSPLSPRGKLNPFE